MAFFLQEIHFLRGVFDTSIPDYFLYSITLESIDANTLQEDFIYWKSCLAFSRFSLPFIFKSTLVMDNGVSPAWHRAFAWEMGI